MIKHIAKWFKQPQTKQQQSAMPAPYELELAYDADGVKAYKFKNPLYLPKCRFSALGQALNDAQLNMTKEDANIYFEAMKGAANNSQWSDVMTMINAMQFYMSQHTTTQTLLEIGCALIVLHGEPADKVQPEWVERKKDMFYKDADFRGFFLRWAYIYLMTFSQQSDEPLTIGEYLSQPMIRQSESLFLKYLTENTEKITNLNGL
jgi:hypothetical protein